MRRLLRKLATNSLSESDDLSTLSEPEVIEQIKLVMG